MFDGNFFVVTFLKLWKAVPVTLEITIVSLAVGVVLGFFIALARVHKVKVLSQISAIYVSFFRGTPIVLQILVVYSVIPSVLNAYFKSIGSSINIFDYSSIVMEGEEEKMCITNRNIIVPDSMYFITIDSPGISKEIQKRNNDVSRQGISYETILDSVKKSFVFSTMKSHIKELYGIRGCGMFFFWNPADLNFHICRNCKVKIVLGTDEYPGLLLLLLHCESEKSNIILGYYHGFESPKGGI